MKNCAIIGGGQLGSRHMQGILSTKSHEITLHIVDPSFDALEVCKTRALEVNHHHTVHYHQELEQLPKELNLVIVATNSKVRLKVLESLLTLIKVDFLILEKVLFPDLESYELATNIIEKTSTKVWVNHPRRTFKAYRALKDFHLNASNHLSFQIVGSQWGLACNGLHFIDLIVYLTSSNLLSLDTSGIDQEIHSSKREGYIEMTGTLSGIMENGSRFTIHSANDSNLIAPAISIMSTKQRIFIQESNTPFIKKYDIDDNFKEVILPFEMEFQSSLSGLIFEQLMKEDNCHLPTFEQSKRTHQIFIQSLLNHYILCTQTDSKILPIT